MRAITDETIHLVFSLIIGVAIAITFGHWLAIPAAVISGSLIDTDHLIDYFLYRGAKFNLREFLSGKTFDLSGKVYVFFHGFEYAFVFFVLAIIFSNYNWLFLALGFSHLIHLIYDTLYNWPIWPTYFLSFCIAKKFDHKTFDFKPLGNAK